jgi:hypothetical protein
MKRSSGSVTVQFSFNKHVQNLTVVDTIHDFLQFTKSDPDSVYFESPYPNPDMQFL